jgi:hypothetical protein
VHADGLFACPGGRARPQAGAGVTHRRPLIVATWMRRICHRHQGIPADRRYPRRPHPCSVAMDPR